VERRVGSPTAAFTALACYCGNVVRPAAGKCNFEIVLKAMGMLRGMKSLARVISMERALVPIRENAEWARESACT
jgi:hypothetical protein